MFRNLWTDRRANYTVAFALLASALVVGAGGTIDIIRFLDAR
jgi:Flp pilus assembly protein TadG